MSRYKKSNKNMIYLLKLILPLIKKKKIVWLKKKYKNLLIGSKKWPIHKKKKIRCFLDLSINSVNHNVISWFKDV